MKKFYIISAILILIFAGAAFYMFNYGSEGFGYLTIFAIWPLCMIMFIGNALIFAIDKKSKVAIIFLVIALFVCSLPYDNALVARNKYNSIIKQSSDYADLTSIGLGEIKRVYKNGLEDYTYPDSGLYDIKYKYPFESLYSSYVGVGNSGKYVQIAYISYGYVSDEAKALAYNQPINNETERITFEKYTCNGLDIFFVTTRGVDYASEPETNSVWIVQDVWSWSPADYIQLRTDALSGKDYSYDNLYKRITAKCQKIE